MPQYDAGVRIEPEWILEGVLPPLLYSSAVSMPAMNFRREFGAISGLSVVLVVGSALLLGGGRHGAEGDHAVHDLRARHHATQSADQRIHHVRRRAGRRPQP